MQTIFMCAYCDNTTGDPKRTDIGLLCEDCVKGGIECLHKNRDLFITRDGSEHERCRDCGLEE